MFILPFFSEADAGLQKQKKLPKAIFFVFGVRGQRSAFTVYNSKKTHPDEIFQEHHIGLPVKKFLTSEQNPSLTSKLDNFFF